MRGDLDQAQPSGDGLLDADEVVVVVGVVGLHQGCDGSRLVAAWSAVQVPVRFLSPRGGLMRRSVPAFAWGRVMSMIVRKLVAAVTGVAAFGIGVPMPANAGQVPAHRPPAHQPQGTISTTPASGPTAGVFIRNFATGQCVDLPGSDGGHPGGPVLQYGCTPNDNQYFTFVNRGGNLWWIQNDQRPYLCLDVPGTGRAPAGTELVQYFCADRDNQYWSPEFHFSYDYETHLSSRISLCPAERARIQCFDYYLLRNFYWNGSSYVDSGLCLDVTGFIPTEYGVRLTVWYSTFGDDHEWTWY
jgi:hypothetical protein